MLSKIRCRMHRLPYGFPLLSAADLKFLHHLPQTRLGPSNRKQPWKHGLHGLAGVRVRKFAWWRCWEVSRASEAGTSEPRGRIGEMPQDQQGVPILCLGTTCRTACSHTGPRPTMSRQQRTLTMRRLGLAIVAALISSAPALAQPNCRNTVDFGRWLADFKREALA